MESGDLEDSGSINIGKLVWLFVVHSLQFVNVLVIIIPFRAGGLFGCALTRVLIYGYWCEFVSSMNMRQVVLCCYPLLYSTAG